jgi:DNA-binding NtrC family response regulator
MHILFIDDNYQLYDILKDNFSYVGHLLLYARNTKKAFSVLRIEKIDVILLDVRLGEENGVETLQLIKEKYSNIPVIMITGYATIDTAVKAMKLGAFDFVKKPIDFDTLCTRIDLATKNLQFIEENTKLKNKLKEQYSELKSKNYNCSIMLDRAKKLAQSDISILIIGENGSGKELLADYIYSNSPRISEKFVKINCAAFPESLLDNELFGHKKGAYTGAESDYMGVFEQASGGTLLLDEVGDMPKTLQAKILRVIQNKEVKKIGSREITKIDVRFIASTNKNIPKMVDEGTFREDLFYRLNGCILELPPLRERTEDLDDLVDSILNELSIESKKPKKELSQAVYIALHSYNWPGNIRELKNVLSYATTLSQDEEILSEDLPPSFKSFNIKGRTGLSINQQREKELIRKILIQNSNNKSETAKELDMSRNTLYLKLKKYGIKV